MISELRKAMGLLTRAREVANTEEWWLVSGMLMGAQEILRQAEREVEPLVEALDIDEEEE